MKYFLAGEHGDRLEVEIEETAPGRFRILVDGEQVQADYSDVDRLGQCAVQLGNQSFAASVETDPADPTRVMVRIAGHSHAFQVLDERERAAGQLVSPSAGRSETVKAAMPGVIVGLPVAVGERVEPGAPVAVLEAMKMQNEVPCKNGGVVAEVLVEVGQTVGGGEALVRLEPPPVEEDAAG
ncbi:MAG: hypothetical protein D6702_10105 [Planctomycetota bacterium]|nr:MAG: hypothetical protein D6702_10105 [Planctomycetota bacterium]